MKKIFIIFAAIISLVSCTQVVDIPLNTENPKLVVEANLKWQKGTAGNLQVIKLTTTTNFYSKNIPNALGASVTVKNEDTNEIFNFVETANTGLYNCTNFNPEMNNNYSIKIVYKGTTYEGTEKLMPVAKIENIIQEANGGITGKEIRVRANYIDPQATTDYYLFNYSFPNLTGMKPDYYVNDDIFTNGNQYFSVSFKDDLKIGDTVKITHFGISQQYYNYLSILLSLSGNQGGGPFQAPPVSVRGNLVNKQNDNDFPYGYFSLSESDTKDYIIK